MFGDDDLAGAAQHSNRALALGDALLLKGDPQRALAEIEQEESEVWKTIGLPMAYPALGRKAESDAALAALIAKYGKDGGYNINPRGQSTGAPDRHLVASFTTSVDPRSWRRGRRTDPNPRSLAARRARRERERRRREIGLRPPGAREADPGSHRAAPVQSRNRSSGQPRRSRRRPSRAARDVPSPAAPGCFAEAPAESGAMTDSTSRSDVRTRRSSRNSPFPRKLVRPG